MLACALTAGSAGPDIELVDDGSRVELTSGRTRYTIPTLPVGDYPTLPQAAAPVGAVDPAAFAAAIAATGYAASTDDTTPWLTGVHIAYDRDGLQLAATDRYRMAATTVPWTRPPQSESAGAVLISARTLTDIGKTLHSGDGPIEFGVTHDASDHTTLVSIAGPDRRLDIRPIDFDRYPDIDQFIPGEFTGLAQADAAALAAAAKRVAVVLDRHTPMHVTFTGDGALGGLLELAAGAEATTAVDAIAADYHGPDLTVLLSPRYLIDTLTALGAGATAHLHLTTPTKPVVITGSPLADQPTGRHLLMPVRRGT